MKKDERDIEVRPDSGDRDELILAALAIGILVILAVLASVLWSVR